jgi:hypothetical protein
MKQPIALTALAARRTFGGPFLWEREGGPARRFAGQSAIDENGAWSLRVVLDENRCQTAEERSEALSIVSEHLSKQKRVRR